MRNALLALSILLSTPALGQQTRAGEVAMNFLLMPAMTAFTGLVAGFIGGTFYMGSVQDNDYFVCDQFVKCQSWSPARCISANEGLNLYLTLGRENATALALMNTMAQQTNQASLKSQVDALFDQCDWSVKNCPSLDESGPKACSAVQKGFWNLVKKPSWIGTVVGGGVGLVLGGICQVESYWKARQGRTLIADV